MEQFKYNPEELTHEQRDQIAATIASCDETLKRLEEQENERMERYYNCEDDYSWGGLCSKANYIQRDKARRARDERIEMIVRGGFIVREKAQSILKDKETMEVVAVGIHDGKYGPYFRTDAGDFVGCAKQLSTFEKKGYVPFVRTVVEKLIPNGWWRDGERRYEVVESTVVDEKVTTEFVY